MVTNSLGVKPQGNSPANDQPHTYLWNYVYVYIYIYTQYIHIHMYVFMYTIHIFTYGIRLRIAPVHLKTSVHYMRMVFHFQQPKTRVPVSNLFEGAKD